MNRDKNMPVVYKLKDCCQIIAGQSPESKYYNTNGEGLPFFQGKADFGALYPKVRMYCSQPTKIAEKDDILLSVRAPVGPTNLSPGKVCIGRGLAAIRPGKEVCLKYLLYFFRYYEAQLQRSGTGTTFKAITQNVVKNIEVPVPSIEEQERIVSKIEELFSKLDASVAELQTANEKLKVYRQAVLKEAFDTCDVYTKISNVCQHVTDGDHMPPPKADSGIPFIMISNIEKGNINWKNTKYVTENYYENIGEIRTPRKGDVLYTVTGSFGIPVMVNFDKKFCFQRHIALLRPNAKITQKYLFYVLQTPYVYTQASKKATGTAQKTVGLSVLRNITIPYCSIKEQIRIIEFLEQSLTICNSIEQTTDISLQQAEALRKSILKQAFDGKI